MSTFPGAQQAHDVDEVRNLLVGGDLDIRRVAIALTLAWNRGYAARTQQEISKLEAQQLNPADVTTMTPHEFAKALEGVA
jgi:hypothetical protein